MHWLGKPLGGGSFDPHHATSTAAEAIAPLGISILYAIGVLSTVFHFSNGLWTLGITWGLWTSPAAMQRANVVSIAVGTLLAAAGLGAIGGLRGTDIAAAEKIEARMEEFRRLQSGDEPVTSAPAGHATGGRAVDLRADADPLPLTLPPGGN